MKPNFEVYFFLTARGTYPVKDFMLLQAKSTVLKITKTIEYLEKGGPFLKMPHAKKIEDNLYELRIQGKEAIRIFYCKVGNEYYLLHAFKKKTNKTPRKEIETALDRLKELP